MASPPKWGKQPVNIAPSGVKVSRIRRDPPPKVKEKVVHPDEVDRRDVVIGVIAFALAIFVIVLALGNRPSGWTPQEYTLQLNAAE